MRGVGKAHPEGKRRQAWKGVGDATTAGGGALLAEEVPVTVLAPAKGAFELEIWLGTNASDARLAGRFRLVAAKKKEL